VTKTQSDAIDTEDHGVESPDFVMRHRESEQSSLFPTEDFIIPDTLRTMRKAVSEIHASPIKSDHTQCLNSRGHFQCLQTHRAD
jgi:hypothetical protein